MPSKKKPKVPASAPAAGPAGEHGPAAEEGAGLGMKRFQSAESQRRFAREVREAGKRIGLVPTMGAFHRGHLSLIEKARAQNDVVVVSVFVNPLQFGPDEDYERYPRDLARDIDLCRAAGVDAVFQPETAEMYPPGFTTKITVGAMGTRLCGAYRPGHFDGVCTVVAKLIGIVMPHRVYLGEKDAQQLLILERMVGDLNMDVKIIGCATVREEDGLALSSRNGYLTPEQRLQAAKIHEALRIAQREILVCHTRDPRALENLMREVMEKGTEMRVEYIQMVDPETLEPRAVLEGRTLIAVRAQLGTTHLIDNLLINVPGGRMAMKFKTPGCEEGRPGGGPELKGRT
jgi:pantoate--beta-alanine ligase